MDFRTIIIPITFFAAILGLVSVVILLFFNKRNVFANRLLAVALFGLTFIWLTDILYLLEWIRKVPHFHRTPLPIHLLVAPASYLYVRTLLYDEHRFRSYDWIHLLPFLAHTLEMSPFFLSDAATKLQAVEQVLKYPDLLAQNPEGILPPYAHFYIKGVLGLAYMFFQWRLVLRFARHTRERRLSYEQTLLGWLIGFTFLMTMLFAFVLISIHFKFGAVQSYLSVRLFTGIMNLFILFFLLFKPAVLYGLHPYAVMPPERSGVRRKEAANEPDHPESKEEDRSSILSPEQERLYAIHIEKFMDKETPFLLPGFSLNDMAEQLEIPRHQLSACINQHFQVNFNDFINERRVRYILEKMPSEKWTKLTIEGVGMEAGFNSRSSFYNAFKKFAGMNPSAFRQSILAKKAAE